MISSEIAELLRAQLAGPMIPIKNSAEIQKMREVCVIAANVLEKMCARVAPGVNTYDLDQFGKELMEGYGASSACYNYQVGQRRFPAHTCISVNEELIHGIGVLKRVLRPGDTVTLDVCVSYNGFIGDNARTLAVGQVGEEVAALIQATEGALYHAIDHARPGKRVGDISNAVQRYIESRNLSVVRDFVGHGVGVSMHEEPQIPNFGDKGKGDKLVAGMTLAIEPMVNLGRPEVEIASNGWTALTCDRKSSAHFEHTVLITPLGSEILTIPKK